MGLDELKLKTTEELLAYKRSLELKTDCGIDTKEDRIVLGLLNDLLKMRKIK